MKREVALGLVGLILILAGTGYTYQLITKSIDSTFSLFFMLIVLVLFILLENIKLK